MSTTATRAANGEPTAPAPLALARGFATGEIAPWDAERWDALGPREALAVLKELAAARRRLDAAVAAASAAVARHSDPADGVDGLSRREGYATPIKLIAATTGGSTAEAGRLVSVGEATLEASRPAATRTPQVPSEGGLAAMTPQPPRFPVMASAVSTGKLSIEKANVITVMLTRVADRVEASVLSAAERHLVERACHLPLDRVAALVRQCEAQLDHDTLVAKENARREARYLNVFENRDGVVVVDGRLDPETAAPLRAALDGLVNDALRRRRDAAGIARNDQDAQSQEPPLADDRSVRQMRADAIADLARHCLGCDADNLPLSNTTVVVRTSLEALTEGIGHAEIDGSDTPISIGTLRRMAADADIIPIVLGGKSEILDLGRSRRLFSKGQRIALVERDGGCAWCHAPPSYCEAHHIKWWYRDRGPTDISNGVMLCTSCHHRIHRDNWGIEVRDGVVWFTPPASVDPERIPIKGGRERYEYGPRDHERVLAGTASAAA
jgi:hypothetical protein